MQPVCAVSSGVASLSLQFLLLGPKEFTVGLSPRGGCGPPQASSLGKEAAPPLEMAAGLKRLLTGSRFH